MWKDKSLSRNNSVVMKTRKDPINRRKFHERNRHKVSHEFPLHSPTKRVGRNEVPVKAKAVAPYSLYRENSYELTSHIVPPTTSKKRKNEPQISATASIRDNSVRDGQREERERKIVTQKKREKASVGIQARDENIADKTNGKSFGKKEVKRSNKYYRKKKVKIHDSSAQRSDIFFRNKVDDDDSRGKKIISKLNNTSSIDQGRYPKRGKKTYGMEHLKSDVDLRRPHKVEMGRFQKRGKFPKFQVEKEKKPFSTKKVIRTRNDSSSVSSLLFGGD